MEMNNLETLLTLLPLFAFFVGAIIGYDEGLKKGKRK